MKEIFVVNVANQAPVFVETSLQVSEFLFNLSPNTPVQIIKVTRHDDTRKDN